MFTFEKSKIKNLSYLLKKNRSKMNMKQVEEKKLIKINAGTNVIKIEKLQRNYREIQWNEEL